MMRCILALFTLLLTSPAHADCFMFCDSSAILPDDQARATLQFIIGAPLPDGVTITAMREGGFQDTFYQARLTGDESAVSALLAIGGLTMEDLVGNAIGFGPDDMDWWDVATRSDLRSADMPSPTLPYAAIGIAPDAEGYTIYLWAFET